MKGRCASTSQIDKISRSDISEIVRLLMTRLDRKHRMKIVSNPLLCAALLKNLSMWIQVGIQVMCCYRAVRFTCIFNPGVDGTATVAVQSNVGCTLAAAADRPKMVWICSLRYGLNALCEHLEGSLSVHPWPTASESHTNSASMLCGCGSPKPRQHASAARSFHDPQPQTAL